MGSFSIWHWVVVLVVVLVLFGGGGKGLGISQAEVKQMLGAMQLKFSGSGSSISGKSSDGTVSVAINGPANNVSGITGTLSGNPAAMQTKGYGDGSGDGENCPMVRTLAHAKPDEASADWED